MKKGDSKEEVSTDTAIDKEKAQANTIQ